MLKISIANEREYDKKHESLEYDLMSPNGINMAFLQTEKIIETGDNYIVVNIESDNNWANYDKYTLLDDVTKTALLIKEMTELQYQIFIVIAQERVHEPMDVATNILNNKITLDTENLDTDDIWEIAIIDNNKYAISH